jgi:hypothetical protein
VNLFINRATINFPKNVLYHGSPFRPVSDGVCFEEKHNNNGERVKMKKVHEGEEEAEGEEECIKPTYHFNYELERGGLVALLMCGETYKGEEFWCKLRLASQAAVNW